MAASVVDAFENELNCPICYEDFEEPKCLPNCAHNICQNCLERMAKRKRKVIECPVCRVESVSEGWSRSVSKESFVSSIAGESRAKREKVYETRSRKL